MEIKTKCLQRDDALKLLGFLRNAYDEYLASRILFNHDLILQASILANTAIEKYFKAILIFKGDKIKHSHNIKGMLLSIKNFDVKLYDNLDLDFINLLHSCYTLRYIDSAPENFKIIMRKKKTLAELDYIVYLIHDKIFIGDEINKKSQYQIDKEANRIELIKNNYIFGNVSKEDFLQGTEDVHEFHIDGSKNFVEIKYQTIVRKKQIFTTTGNFTASI